MTIDDSGTLPRAHPKPAWRGWLHTAGMVVAAPAGAALVASASSLQARVAVAVFAISLVGLFAASACYHRLITNDRFRPFLRRLDHSMIFVLIAGTFTPLCLLALDVRFGVPLLIAVWTAATVGVIAKLWHFDRLDRVGSIMYISLGWTGVVLCPALLATSPVAFWLMLAGGLTYTAGALVLRRNSPNPAPATFGFHEVWHAATLAAAGCHFVMVAQLVNL